MSANKTLKGHNNYLFADRCTYICQHNILTYILS